MHKGWFWDIWLDIQHDNCLIGCQGRFLEVQLMPKKVIFITFAFLTIFKSH